MKNWPNLALFAVFLAVLLVVAGCARQGDPPAQGDTSPASRGTVRTAPEVLDGGVSVWVDPETGCEYLFLYNKAATPRMEYNSFSATPQRHKGCEDQSS